MNSSTYDQKKVTAFGENSTPLKPDRSTQILSFFFDLFVFVFTFQIVLLEFGVSPLDLKLFSLAPISASVVLLFFLRRFGHSVGLRFFRVERVNGKFIHKGKTKASRVFFAKSVSVFSFLLLPSLWLLIFQFHFVFKNASRIEWSPFLPEKLEHGQVPISFYYASGAWPTQFKSLPILFALPYEKGPPTQFLGHVVAYFQKPSIFAEFSGPKTPLSQPTIDFLEECFTKSMSIACLSLREEILTPHWKALRARGASENFEFNFFEVRNTVLDVGDWMRGFKVSAALGEKIITHYVMVNSKGAEQTIVLSRLKTPDGEQAQWLVEQFLRSAKLSSELASPRAVTEARLAEIDLKKVSEIKAVNQWLGELAKTHAALISRFTVKPDDLDALYHLGGTSLLFLKKVVPLRVEGGSATGAAGAGNETLTPEVRERIDEWSASLKPLLRNVAQYAKDIAPNDPRTVELEGMAATVRK